MRGSEIGLEKPELGVAGVGPFLDFGLGRMNLVVLTGDAALPIERPALPGAVGLLQGAAVFALEAHVMDELFETGHVLGLLSNVMEDLLFGQHLNELGCGIG